ncbi:MAG: AraC family transcriptional regulator [Synergistaceae bacterium]|jgi:AraC-like DNA-binding protein|nr:AraC family transcriptional regulator [Synergistaceae bacterium]
MERSSYEVYRLIDRESERLGLEIRWAGEVWCKPGFVLNRYHKRFLLIYIYDGVCLYDDGNQFLRLEPGNLILYKPHEYQHYKTEEGAPLHYYGIAFSGRMVEEIMAGMPLVQESIHNVGVDSNLAKAISNLIKQMMIVPPSRSEIIWGEFFRVLGSINDVILNGPHLDCASCHQALQLKTAERYITLNYNVDLNIKEIAQIAGYSVSWFEKLFHKHYGMSPITYQMKLRIEKAQNIICTDILSLAEISFAVGFNDPLYFSKVFKKHVGMCPKQYRMLQRKNVSRDNRRHTGS